MVDMKYVRFTPSTYNDAFRTCANTPNEQFVANINAAVASGLPMVQKSMKPGSLGMAALVGGGPSLVDTMGDLWWHKRVGSAIFAMNAVPAQLKLGDFEKRITELADRANRREYTNERIKQEILDKAKDLDFDLPEKNVEIDRNDKRIKIYVHFDQVIRLPGYVWVRPQEIRMERPMF